MATLGTFMPPDATVNTRGQVSTASVTERSLWSDTLFSETTVEMHGYQTTVTPRGTGADGAAAGDDARQLLQPAVSRDDDLSVHRVGVRDHAQRRVGLHLFKAGHRRPAQPLPRNEREPVGARSAGPTARWRAGSTSDRRRPRRRSTAPTWRCFAQDRFQPTARWYLEFGGRLDRDGVIDRFNITPRVGSAVLLNASGSSVLRSGYGLFYERTPSVAGAFEQYEAPLDTRFAADGVTPLGPPVLFSRVTSPDLRTSRSLTWDLAFDHRLNRIGRCTLGVIDRRGSHELLVGADAHGHRVCAPAGERRAVAVSRGRD